MPIIYLNRDYNLPTWQDKIDRSNLPKIKQVRRGDEHKQGRTKYTHLTAEDTTNFDPKYEVPDNIVNNLVSKMGGIIKENHKNFSNNIQSYRFCGMFSELNKIYGFF
jgi:microfibrillar-associated protein 1